MLVHTATSDSSELLLTPCRTSVDGAGAVPRRTFGGNITNSAYKVLKDRGNQSTARKHVVTPQPRHFFPCALAFDSVGLEEPTAVVKADGSAQTPQARRLSCGDDCLEDGEVEQMFNAGAIPVLSVGEKCICIAESVPPEELPLFELPGLDSTALKDIVGDVADLLA